MAIKAVVVYSGGMDSFTVLRLAAARVGAGHVLAVSFNYGQRHARELDSARKVCQGLGVEHLVIPLDFGALLTGSSLTSDILVPEGHYEDESMKQTVVPNRNMIMLSIAAGIAVSRGAETLYCGVHAGDHAIYPDCRPEFINAMRRVLHLANYTSVELLAPMLYQSKGGILREGLNSGIPVSAYADTWTCYNGREKPCGKCGACQERLEAFAVCGFTDPLEYE